MSPHKVQLLGWSPKQWALVAGWDKGPLGSIDDALNMQVRWQRSFSHEPDEVPTILTNDNRDPRAFDWGKAREIFRLLPKEILLQ